MLITDTIQQQNGTKIIDADHIVSLKEHMQVKNSKYFQILDQKHSQPI